jgi:WD40 repeat protein
MESSIEGTNYYSINTQRITLNKNEVEGNIEDIACKICDLVPVELESCANCNSIFCKPCIHSFLKTNNDMCFYCKKIYKKSDTLTDIQIKILDNIIINCRYFQVGWCNETLRHSLTLAHEKTCQIKKKACDWCKKEFNYKELLPHLEVCEEAVIRCNDCDYQDSRKQHNSVTKLILHVQHTVLEHYKKHMDSQIAKLKEEMITLTQQITAPTISEDEVNHNKNIQKLREIKPSKTISKNFDNSYMREDRFCIFQNFEEEWLLAFGNQNYSIEVHNLTLNKIDKEIKDAHSSNIILCRCYKPSKPEIQMTYVLTSSYDRSIKLWDCLKDWQILISITEAHANYSILSCKFLNTDMFEGEEIKNYIISSNSIEKCIKIWEIENLQENKWKLKREIKEKGIQYLDVYYDDVDFKYYIYCCNEEEINSYDVNLGDLYKNYITEQKTFYSSAAINKFRQIIGCDNTGFIRVWEFHSANLLFSISCSIKLSGMFMWDSQVVLACGTKNSILLFDLKKQQLVKAFNTEHGGYIYCLKGDSKANILYSCGYDSCIKEWNIPPLV